MKTKKTCTICAGTGYQADVGFGGKLFRNTKKLCNNCSGQGQIEVDDKR